MIHVLLLLGCAVVIYLACEWFINAVEWLGVQLNVGPIAVGTILAAVGTALPESVVTLVAVTFGGGPHGDDIGVGAALGGPLVVGTIAYATVGATLMVRRWQASCGQATLASVPDTSQPDEPPAPLCRLMGLSSASTTDNSRKLIATLATELYADREDHDDRA